MIKNMFRMSRLKAYVLSELKDTVSLERLNGNDIPELSQDKLDELVESILFDINEIGPDYDLQELIGWNLEQNLSHS